MALFLNSVLKKHLNALNPAKIDQAYQQYAKHFHNTTIQENIRIPKEEQYQGEFLIYPFLMVMRIHSTLSLLLQQDMSEINSSD